MYCVAVVKAHRSGDCQVIRRVACNMTKEGAESLVAFVEAIMIVDAVCGYFPVAMQQWDA